MKARITLLALIGPAAFLLAFPIGCAGPRSGFLTVIGMSGPHEVDKERLRELAGLPTIFLLFGFNFGGSNGFTLPGDEANTAAELASLRATMKNNACNAEQCLRLWELSENQKECDLVLTRAIALFREQLKAQPRNARVSAMLGRALAAETKYEEAEELLRKAVKLDPNDARCWIDLSKFALPCKRNQTIFTPTSVLPRCG